MIIFMSLIGVVTIMGVIIIAAVEIKRMEKGKPSILSRETEEKTR